MYTPDIDCANIDLRSIFNFIDFSLKKLRGFIFLFLVLHNKIERLRVLIIFN